jgi:hypothetical protein
MTNKYEVIFDKKEDTALIRITDGKFVNFVFQFGEVSIGNEEYDGSLPINFTYDLKEAPESYTYENEEAEKAEFENLIGDILYDIVVNTNKVNTIDGNDDTD